MRLRAFAIMIAVAAILHAETRSVSRLPMSFERNVGQAAADVRYLGRNGEGTVLLKAREMVFLGSHGSAGMRFRGASPQARMDATEQMPGVSHYFIGHSTIPDVPQYGRVTYRNLYPGISLVLRGNPAELEYDFVVSPGAKPGLIQIAFEGLERMELTASGDLILHTPTGELRQQKPSAFQEIAGKRMPVEVEYELAGSRNIRFRIGAYDSAELLVIDPAVVYTSTPLQQGKIYDLATDEVGNVYMTGPVAGGRGVCGSSSFFGQTYIIPCNDAFVAKLDPTGTQVLYYTVLGGMSEDHGVSIAADSAGNAYVLGNTYSTDFPVSANAAQTKFAGPTGPILLDLTGGDLFIAKLDPFGRLLYSTFLGGPGNDVAGRIRIDLAGNAYVSCFSYSSDFPTTAGVYLSGRAIGGPVVAKINPAGTQLVWATYLDVNFGPQGIDLDAAGAVYVASGPAVVKLSADGGSLLYRGVFGQESDITYDLSADSQGSAWAVGHNDDGGGFIRKISPDGSTLVFAMEFGRGNRSSYGVVRRVAVDAGDRAYVSGVWTQLAVTPDALLANPADTYAPGFLSVFNPDGTVAYASYTPKPFVPLAIDSSGQVYATDGISVVKMDLRRP